MERFEFDNRERLGGNTNRKNGSTTRGAIQLDSWLASVMDQDFVTMGIRGPAGAERGSAVLDKATAGKLGAELLKWAGVDLVSVASIREFLSIDDAGEMAASEIRRFLDDQFSGQDRESYTDTQDRESYHVDPCTKP